MCRSIYDISIYLFLFCNTVLNFAILERVVGIWQVIYFHRFYSCSEIFLFFLTNDFIIPEKIGNLLKVEKILLKEKTIRIQLLHGPIFVCTWRIMSHMFRYLKFFWLSWTWCIIYEFGHWYIAVYISSPNKEIDFLFIEWHKHNM